MNIFHKVTLQSLKKNKVRTIVTIIGIILSAAMICAVTTFVSSMFNYALESTVYIDGDWHGSETNAEYAVYEKIADSDDVESAIYMQQLGYAVAEGCQNEYKPYIYLLGASAEAENMLPVHITAGNYPTRTDEILLPAHLSENGGVRHKVGDVITLALGERMSDGFVLHQNNPAYVYEGDEETLAEETLEVRESRTYTVVGFYERPSFEDYSAPGYTAITLADAAPTEDFSYEIYFKMKKPQEIYTFMEINGLTGNTNNSVLTYSGVSRYDGFISMLTGLAVIFIVLIMFGSVSLIYNAFSISVSERTKQFGLLSSVGATKKQLRKMVFFEALSVSAVGIPLGILVGITGIGITLLLIGHKFESLIGVPVPLTLSVSPASIVIAVLVALVTVLISAWIPSKRATKISAVEAIRQNQDIQIKGRAIKTSKLTYKLFGLPGVLANKHYKRSKKKYRATIISLFMSIVLFVSASAFTDYLMDAATVRYNSTTYDLRLWTSEAYFSDLTPDQLLAMFKEDTSVTDAAYVTNSWVCADVHKSYLTEEAKQQLPETVSSDISSMDITLSFVNDSAYKELLAAYHLDEATYMNPENPLAIAIDGNVSFDSNQQKYVTTKILRGDNAEMTLPIHKEFEGYYHEDEFVNENGETICRYAKNDNPEEVMEVPFAEACDKTSVQVGKTIYEKPFYIDSLYNLVLVYPCSLQSAVLLPTILPTQDSYQYYMTSSNHAESYQAIKETLTEQGIAVSNNLYDYAEAAEGNRNLVTIIQVFSYGFIVLISLIAAANVFNTISTNISLRRREFAMLKSVGMSAKGFNRMMNFECLLYGSRALLYGLPVAAGVTYLIYLVITEGYATGFRLPWTSIGIAVLSVFAVVFVTMMYSMGKIKKDNPIDALKNENM